MPVIIFTPTDSPDSTPYVPRTPSPGTYAHHSTDNWGIHMGCDTRSITPVASYDPWAHRDTATTPPAAIPPNEFWDNVDIPYSAYSPPTVDPQITEPHHHQVTGTPAPGIILYRTVSSHPSLYQPSRSPSPVPRPTTSIPQHTATGRMLMSSDVHNAP